MKTEHEILEFLITRLKHWDYMCVNSNIGWEGNFTSEGLAYNAYCAKYNEVVTILLFMGYDQNGDKIL